MEIVGRGVYPISELLEEAEFPLAEHLPMDQVSSLFDGLYYSEASIDYFDEAIVIDAVFAVEQEITIPVPGTDLVSLVFFSGGIGWSAFRVHIVLGREPSFSFIAATAGIRFSEEILKDKATDGPAELEISADIIFNSDGVAIENALGLTLRPAYLCNTEILVEAQDIRTVFGPIEPPEFLYDHADFQGLTIETLSVTLPDEYIKSEGDSAIKFQLTNSAIGTTGFTGELSVASEDLANPIKGDFLGFPFRFRFFNLSIIQNAFIDVSLGVDVRIEALEENDQEKWIGLDGIFHSTGDMSVALSASQPTEAGQTATAIATAKFEDVFELNLNNIRLEKNEEIWSFFISGGFEILIDGAVDWPLVNFDEIGIDSNGKLLIPDGGGIIFATPLIVNWHFVRLTIPKFRFGYAPGSDEIYELSLNAEVLLIDGIPAGASVKGLSVQWNPNTDDNPNVTFEGIGIKFGVPGTFNAAMEVSYKEENGAIEFRGQGGLELTALDMGIEIGVIFGYQAQTPQEPEEYVYCYLFMDAKLLPTGIPIGQTGLSIYGFQGLIAYNMELAINRQLPADERYYELFVRSPKIGVTHVNKWQKRKGQNALGIGAVLGTADKGFSLNVKGLLVVAFPDLTILLQSRVNFVKLAPDLSTQQEGALDALMVYAQGQSTLTLDIVAYWGMPSVIEVTGNARAFFSFADPDAWYLQIGVDEDGKRIVAKALKWGNKWLFSAGFWFQLDKNGAVTGIEIEVELRASSGGFWVEAIGGARGVMSLVWQPTQFEGSLALWGRVGAGYHGVSIGIAFDGYARARAKKPFDVLVEVEACINLLFDDVCASFDFEWQRLDPPDVQHPLRRWAAKPLHWTAHQTGGSNEQDTGIKPLSFSAPGGQSPHTLGIQPHSIISLDFAKSMSDVTGYFDESVDLDNQGYITIGNLSGYSARYQLNDIRLIRDPLGNAEPVSLYGTWARETLEVNSTLRLMSSQRFAHDGTLSNSFVDDVDLDYCDPAREDEICIDVTQLEPGIGWLPHNLGLYQFQSQTGINGLTEPVAGIGRDDRLEMHIRYPTNQVRLKRRIRSEKKTGFWTSICERCVCHLTMLSVLTTVMTVITLFLALLIPRIYDLFLIIAICVVFFTLILLIILFVCCRYRDSIKPTGTSDENGSIGSSGIDGQDNGDSDDEADNGVVVPNDGNIVVIHPGDDDSGGDGEDENTPITTICIPTGHGKPDLGLLRRRGGTITEIQSWNVPAEARILQPSTRYRLEVQYSVFRKNPDHTIHEVINNAIVKSDFTTSGPPIYEGALNNYIQYVYPLYGQRPVFTGYDLVIAFVEDYVPYLYVAVGELLVIKLCDADGKYLIDENGDVLLVPISQEGHPETKIADLRWEEIYKENKEKGCITRNVGTRVRQNISTLSPVDHGFELTFNSQYRAQLVSTQNPEVALYDWTFTTSRFSSFTHMLSTLIKQPTLLRNQVITETSFDQIANSLDISTINYVENVLITPIKNDQSNIALLLEAPEPMEMNSRLNIMINGEEAVLFPNIDHTRGFILPTNSMWGTGQLNLEFRWKRYVDDSYPKLQMSGNTDPEYIEIELNVGDD